MSLNAVFLDSREPSNITNLKFGGIPVAVTMLDCGDLWASTNDGHLLVIERKTPSDLLGSIKDGRLFQQAAAIREKTQWGYLLVTGLLAHTKEGFIVTDNRVTGWQYDDVQGALISVQEMGVCLLSCQSDHEYEETVLRLCRRSRSAEKVLQQRVQPKLMTQAEVILTSLPGIGLERAGLLLGEHGSAAYSIAWLTWLNTFAEISGIGDGTKQKVRTALGLLPDEWLSVMDTEKSAHAAKHLQEERTPVLGVPA